MAQNLRSGILTTILGLATLGITGYQVYQQPKILMTQEGTAAAIAAVTAGATLLVTEDPKRKPTKKAAK